MLYTAQPLDAHRRGVQHSKQRKRKKVRQRRRQGELQQVGGPNNSDDNAERTLVEKDTGMLSTKRLVVSSQAQTMEARSALTVGQLVTSEIPKACPTVRTDSTYQLPCSKLINVSVRLEILSDQMRGPEQP